MVVVVVLIVVLVVVVAVAVVLIIITSVAAIVVKEFIRRIETVAKVRNLKMTKPFGNIVSDLQKTHPARVFPLPSAPGDGNERFIYGNARMADFLGCGRRIVTYMAIALVLGIALVPPMDHTICMSAARRDARCAETDPGCNNASHVQVACISIHQCLEEPSIIFVVRGRSHSPLPVVSSFKT